jgi:hypothetical protein
MYTLAQFGLSPDQWTALSAIGSILSALGTLAAVIVALYLAVRDKRSKLSVTSSIMQMMPSGRGSQQPSVIVLTVTNTGFMPAAVKGVFWQAGFFRKQKFVQQPSEHMLTEKLPKELAHGQQVVLTWDLETMRQGADTIVKDLQGRIFKELRLSTLRLGVYTSLGLEFSAVADPRIRDIVRERLRNAGA